MTSEYVLKVVSVSLINYSSDILQLNHRIKSIGDIARFFKVSRKEKKMVSVYTCIHVIAYAIFAFLKYLCLVNNKRRPAIHI